MRQQNRPPKCVLEATAAHDAFLARIGNKIGVVGKHGNLTRTSTSHDLDTINSNNNTYTPISNHSPFIKPLNNRKLPVVARKFITNSRFAGKLTNDKSMNGIITSELKQKEKEVEEKAKDLKNKMTEETSLIEPNRKTVLIQSLIPGSLSVSLDQDEVVEESIHLLEDTQEEVNEDIISELETNKIMPEAEVIKPKKSKSNIQTAKTKEKSALEMSITRKINEWTVWEVDGLRELTRLIEPLYALDKLSSIVKADLEHDTSEVEIKHSNTFNFDFGDTYSTNLSNFYADLNANHGFLFLVDDLKVKDLKGSFDSRVKTPSFGFDKMMNVNQKTNQSAKHYPYMRNLPPSIPSEKYNAVYSHTKQFTYTSTPASLMTREPTPKKSFRYSMGGLGSESASGTDEIVRVFEYPDVHDREFNLQLGWNDNEMQSQTSHSPFTQNDIPPPIQKSESSNTFELNRSQQRDQRNSSVPSMSRVSSARSFRSQASTQSSKVKLSIPPPVEVTLGKLGPDKENENYLAKLGKTIKQKEYSDRIRQLAMSKSKKKKRSSINETDSNLIINHETFRDKPGDKPTTKLPVLVNYEEKISRSLTKHQKVISFDLSFFCQKCYI
ncbi:hypothetical protein BC833DRAFT_223531 [Globomyces pollinis-pini]|nr:hypothetical protein BC833DRAFT_223531 [Globomyces pollinis-pini]